MAILRGKPLSEITFADIAAAEERMFYRDLGDHMREADEDYELNFEPDYEAMEFNPSAENPWE